MKLTIILKLEIKKKKTNTRNKKEKKNKKKETWLKGYELTSAKKRIRNSLHGEYITKRQKTRQVSQGNETRSLKIAGAHRKLQL